MHTIEEILKETQQYIAVKEASFKGGFKRASAMEGIDSMPGAEHDSKVPGDYKNPDAEVDDGSQGPEGAFSNINGAGKEDITMQHVLEVDESAESPDEEPLITDEADADPKTASTKVANKLLSRIQQFQNTKRAANQKINMKLDDKMLDKLAGQKPEGKKVSTKDIARQLVSNVLAQKQAAAAEAERQGAEDALRDVLNSAYEQGAKDAAEKIAQMMDPAAMGGAPMDPSAMGGQDAMAAMAGAPAPAAPEAVPAVAEAAPAAPEATQEAGGEDAGLEVPENLEGEDVSAEDIVEALDSAVESGEIDPETAQAVLSEIAAGEGEEAPADADAKEAAVKFAAAIDEAHEELVKDDEAVKFAQAIEEAVDEIEDAEADEDEGDDEEAPTVEEIEQAVSELVDEGEIEPDAGAAILEQISGGGDEGEDEDDLGDKEAAVKFAQAIEEAAEECGAGDDSEDGGEGSDEEVDPEALIEGIAELVESGEVSPEDAEDAIHAIIGDEE